MKFNIPRTLRFLPLQEYDPEKPELAGVGFQIWVDPPRSVLVEFDDINRAFRQELDRIAAQSIRDVKKKPTAAETLLIWLRARVRHANDSHFQEKTAVYRKALFGWYVRLWSQAADPETHWTVDELEKICDNNPHLYEWLCTSSWAMIDQHREDVKKGWRGPSVRSPEQERPATPS
jgi:hypothetical protein